MARFTISSLLEGPADLREQLPATGTVFDARSGPDGITYFCARLDSPLKYHLDQSDEIASVAAKGFELDSAGTYVTIHEVVMRSSSPATQPYEGVQRFAVDLAYTMDMDYIENGQIDFRRILPVAAAEVDGEYLAIAEVAANNSETALRALSRSNVHVPSDSPAPGAGAAAAFPADQAEAATSTPDAFGNATHLRHSASRETSAIPHRYDGLRDRPVQWPAGPAPVGERKSNQVRVAPLQEYAQRRGRPNRVRAAVAAGVVAVAVVGVGVWVLMRPDGADDRGSTVSASDLSSKRAVAQLEGLLPKGYSSDNCAAAGGESRPTLTCGPSTEPGGPTTASYAVESDQGALNLAFAQTIAELVRMNCPGSIQSPGPWRRNSAPETPAGTLFCGTHDGKAIIAWTDNERLLFSVAQGGPQGPDLDQLYTWWANHS